MPTPTPTPCPMTTFVREYRALCARTGFSIGAFVQHGYDERDDRAELYITGDALSSDPDSIAPVDEDEEEEEN